MTRTPEPSPTAASLFEAIAHGDEEHRAWLKEAIQAHLSGHPVPPPRGGGRKEARIAELEGWLGWAARRLAPQYHSEIATILGAPKPANLNHVRCDEIEGDMA